MPSAWYVVGNAAAIPSPALLVYPDRVEENIRRMIRVAGRAERLRPHLKTTKLPEVVRMLLAQGVTKFKTATIAETEMAAGCGAPDILFAYQPVGPNVDRLIAIGSAFPATTFSALADDEDAVHAMSVAAVAAGVTLRLYLDIDVGMHRTGVEAGPAAAALYRLIASLPGLDAAGLHVYDGHINDSDRAVRTRMCDEAFAPVQVLRDDLVASGIPVPAVIAGGTPTFPLHARRPDVECGPGTTLFWDAGYGTTLPDLDFLPAAVLLTRVVSKPVGSRICLDLGHKAVASEMPHPRVSLLDLPDARAVGHSEEHLVLETAYASDLSVGSVVYGIPHHICPTVALYNDAVVVRDGTALDRWPIVGRTRALTI